MPAEKKSEKTTDEQHKEKLRTSFLHFRVNTDDREQLKKLAAAEKKTVSDFMRSQVAKVLKESGLAPKEKRTYKRADPRLLAEIARVGNNLNQIARWANTYKTEAESFEITVLLVGMERQIKELLSHDD